MTKLEMAIGALKTSSEQYPLPMSIPLTEVAGVMGAAALVAMLYFSAPQVVATTKRVGIAMAALTLAMVVLVLGNQQMSARANMVTLVRAQLEGECRGVENAKKAAPDEKISGTDVRAIVALCGPKTLRTMSDGKPIVVKAPVDKSVAPKAK